MLGVQKWSSHSLLQIRITPLGQGLPNPAIMLFNHPIRGIMPVVNRPPIGSDNDKEHHNVLINRQCRNDKDNDTSKHFHPLPIGSTVAVKCEDGGPWTHGTIEEKGNHNHHNRSYKIHITTTGKTTTCKRQHLKPTPISAEWYSCAFCATG